MATGAVPFLAQLLSSSSGKAQLQTASPLQVPAQTRAHLKSCSDQARDTVGAEG